MEKRKKTGKGVGLRQKAKKAGGRVFAADIFVAILQPGIKVYCAVLRTSLSPRDLFVHSPSAGSIITDLSLLRETPMGKTDTNHRNLPAGPRYGNLHCIAVNIGRISRGAKSRHGDYPRSKIVRVLRIIFATVLLHVLPKTPRGEAVKWGVIQTFSDHSLKYENVWNEISNITKQCKTSIIPCLKLHLLKRRTLCHKASYYR